MCMDYGRQYYYNKNSEHWDSASLQFTSQQYTKTGTNLLTLLLTDCYWNNKQRWKEIYNPQWGGNISAANLMTRKPSPLCMCFQWRQQHIGCESTKGPLFIGTSYQHHGYMLYSEPVVMKHVLCTWSRFIEMMYHYSTMAITNVCKNPVKRLATPLAPIIYRTIGHNTTWAIN